MSTADGTGNSSLIEQEHADIPETYDPNASPEDGRVTPGVYGTTGDHVAGGALEVAREHGFHAALVPWRDRKWNPVDVMARIRSHMDNVRPTKSTTNWTEVTGILEIEHGAEGPRCLHPAFGAVGAWEYSGPTGRVTEWVSPHYIHLGKADVQYADLVLPESVSVPHDPIPAEIVEKRAEWTRWGFSVGLKQDTIAARWGSDGDGLYQFARRRGWPLEEWRREGMETRARTMATMLAWGETQTKVGQAFGITRQTVQWNIDNHAPDYEPPSVNVVNRRGNGRYVD